MLAQIKEKHFPNKKFYVHLREHTQRAQVEKAMDLIRSFGGQIEQFLTKEISFVLTDIPDNADPILENAHRLNAKIMSLKQLVKFAHEYAKASGGSDENDNAIADAERYFNKIGTERPDAICRDFRQLPIIRIRKNLQIGQSIFEDPVAPTEMFPTNNVIPCNQYIAQPPVSPSLTATPTPHATPNATPNTSQREQGVRRRNSPYCEICDIRIVGKIEEHVQTPAHKDNSAKLDWSPLDTIINTLPSLSTLSTMRRLTNYITDEHKEFICLHKTESISQLFDHSKNN